MSLIVTGSIGIDSIETPSGSAEEVLGGSSIYFAAAASFFGPVRLVGVVGADFPPAFLETFKRFHVDLAGLEKRAGSKTFRWRGKYHQDMNVRDTLSVELNVLAEAQPPVPPPYCDSRYVFLANTHPSNQIKLLESFPNRTLAVADTMDLWIKTEQPTLRQLLRRLDGLVLNDSEACQLTGETNMLLAAEAIMACGPRFVVIKRGEHGAWLVHQDGLAAIPAFPTRKVIDPTGAGDSFAGAMMGHLAATGDLGLSNLRLAMAYGTIVASFAIEAFSLERLLTLAREDIEQRLGQYRAMLTL